MIKISQEKGVIIIIAFLTLGVLILLGTYFLSFTLTESRISKIQEVATQTYYLAEAGINEAIWKVKYDDKDVAEDGDLPWATCFVTSTAPCLDCTTWSATFKKNTDVLIPNSSTTVTIQNTACAEGELTATSTIALPGGKTAQRVVKTTVFKALAPPTEDSPVFTGGPSENIIIDGVYLKVEDGNIFSNNNLIIRGGSIVEVYDNPITATSTDGLEGQILVESNLQISADSTVDNCETKCAKNTCQMCLNNTTGEECSSCPSASADVPLVDFDSDSSNSFKNRAQAAENAGQCEILCNGAICICDGSPCPGGNKCVLDDEEFEDLLWAAGEGGTLALNTTTTPGIVYVEGPIEIRGGRKVVVNGALVADDNIKIGKRSKWKGDTGFSQITINRPTGTTTSGLLTKRNIDFGEYSSFTTTTVIGVIYTNDTLEMTSVPNRFKVRGGIIGRKLTLTSLWQWLNITLDNEIILYGLGYKIDDTPISPTYSPIITVEHWEETY